MVTAKPADCAVLTINEIFHSIQGESTHAGRPCVFGRVTGCDLRWSWCDAPYAFQEGRKMSVDEVVGRVRDYGCDVVEIRGGEPLLQKEVYPLMQRLVDEGCTVMLETGGHLSVAEVPEAVIRIIDVKCPGSGESGRNHWPNLDRLRPTDEIKFVLKDRADYEYARDVVARLRLIGRCAAGLFSPVHAGLDPQEPAAGVLTDPLPVPAQLQTHKYIWAPTTPG